MGSTAATAAVRRAVVAGSPLTALPTSPSRRAVSSSAVDAAVGNRGDAHPSVNPSTVAAAAAEASLLASDASTVLPLRERTATLPLQTEASLSAAEACAAPVGLVSKSAIAAATPLLAAAIPWAPQATVATPVAAALSAVPTSDLGAALLSSHAARHIERSDERAAVAATDSSALPQACVSVTFSTPAASSCVPSSSCSSQFAGLPLCFAFSGSASTPPVRPAQPRSYSCPYRRFLASVAAQSGCDMLLLLDDKLLLLLLSFLNLQEQLLCFLPLTRRLYAAALRIPFVKHLVLPPPGHAFDTFISEIKVKCVSYFPPHNRPTSGYETGKTDSGRSSSSRPGITSSPTKSTKCSNAEADRNGGTEGSEGSEAILTWHSSETSCSSRSTTCSSSISRAPCKLSSSSARVHSSSSAGRAVGDSANESRIDSWCSRSRATVVCMPGACSCCCIPVSFLRLSRLQSADIAAPAFTPPSPLLALLLLMNARSLKNLRIRGVDEGSVSWNASFHERCQQHPQAVQQQQQQSLKRQAQLMQQRERHQSEAVRPRIPRPKEQCLQHEKGEEKYQQPQRKSSPDEDRGQNRWEKEDHVRITAATAPESQDATPHTTPGTMAAAQTPAEAAVKESPQARTPAAGVYEREEAWAATGAAEGGCTGTPRKRVRLKEDAAQPAREGDCNWEAMLADSLQFAAAASATPALFHYMRQLHRNSGRHRDASEVEGGCTVVLLTEQGSDVTPSLTPTEPALSSDKHADAASSDRTGVPGNAASTTTRDNAAVPVTLSEDAGGEDVLLEENKTGFCGEGDTTAAEEEDEKERALYWLPRRALRLLLGNARSLETLAIDVSRRKGLFRVSPLARLFLLEEEFDVGCRSSAGNYNASQSNLVFSRRDSPQMLEQQSRRQQLQHAQEQLGCGGGQQACFSVQPENLWSAGGIREAGEQHGYNSSHSIQCESPLSRSSTTAGGFGTHIITAASCCEGQDTYSGGLRDGPAALLTEAGDELLVFKDRGGSEGQRACCRLRELEVCNITPTTFVCGYISLPQLRILKLHFVEIASCERSVHDLGGLLQGCPLLEDFAVHTDSDDDQIVFLNRLLIRSLGRFLRTRESRKCVTRISWSADDLPWWHQNRQKGQQLQQEQLSGGQCQQYQQPEEHRHQQQGNQQQGQRRLLQQQHGLTQLLAEAGCPEADTNARPAKGEENKNVKFTLHRESEMVSEEDPPLRRLHHLKSFQMMLLDIRVIELLAETAPNLQVLRLIEVEAFRSSRGRNVLVTAVRRLPHLRRVELLGGLSETEGSSMLEALFDEEARARNWPPGALSLHHGASVVQNFFLPQL